jgi:hypothetical protein
MTDALVGEEQELVLLGPWRRAYEAHYGRAPELRTDAGTSTLTFRREVDDPDLYRRMVGTLGRFADKPKLRERVRALGYGWDEDGLLLTVPLPTALLHRMRALGLHGSGFVPEFIVLNSLDLPIGAWLLRLAAGTVPIQVGTAELYSRETSRPPRGKGKRRQGRWTHHLLSLLHDMTKHVLPLHMVPRATLEQLGERVVSALGPLRRRVARETRWARLLSAVPKEWLAPVALLTFYENDLVDYGHAVWSAIEVPEDFEPTFLLRRHYTQLEDVLSRRIEQARALGFPAGEAPPRPYARFEIDGPAGG